MISFFTLCFFTLKVDIQDGAQDYKEVNLLTQYFLMTYRNSVGDIKTPQYDKWQLFFNENDTKQRVGKLTLISLMWIVWFLNLNLNLIILLNFLIAVIS